MEKDQKTNSETHNNETEEINVEGLNNDVQPSTPESNELPKETTSEEKILELEDKLARAFAEMENQRRRFEKEREDAFSYGGFAFAKETLKLIEDMKKSKQIEESDKDLKN